ncbi:MAG: diguanylate cyclase, partial [Candidatus Competibacteraceae bacterium]|nr:diguanylate cyclase [Candidatus Competibacteraceae bacterium]
AALFSKLLARRLQRYLWALVLRCQEIADGHLQGQLSGRGYDQELRQLIEAFNFMASRLNASQVATEQAHSALKKANEQLEGRVAQRTAALEQTNHQLRQEIRERVRIELELKQAAQTDPLTGLLNRRAMRERLEYQAALTRRQHTPFCILLADLDHFKRINDEYGHEAGDRMLIGISELLRQRLRGQDAVARWGGEEMLMLLPTTRSAGAVQLAKGILEQIEQFSINGPDGSVIRTTGSIGLSEFGPSDSIEDCIARADQALYRAKAGGRNQVQS